LQFVTSFLNLVLNSLADSQRTEASARTIAGWIAGQ
jgi:hypothetical protein